MICKSMELLKVLFTRLALNPAVECPQTQIISPNRTAIFNQRKLNQIRLQWRGNAVMLIVLPTYVVAEVQIRDRDVCVILRIYNRQGDRRVADADPELKLVTIVLPTLNLPVPCTSSPRTNALPPMNGIEQTRHVPERVAPLVTTMNRTFSR